MPLPRRVARMNRVFLDRVLRPLARHAPGFGVIEHHGRRSGATYRTPVNIFRQPDGYLVALTYGVGDWVRNVLAEGSCTLETRGRRYRMVEPRLVHDEERRDVPRILRFVGAIGNVSDFVYLRFADARMRSRRRARVPGWIPLFNLMAKPLIAAGIPLGPDVLLTVRGRKSGRPRTTPVAVAEIGGRAWLLSPFGETEWAKNLRAAGRATLRAGRRRREVTTAELDREARIAFYRDVLEPYLRTNAFATWIVRNLDRIPPDPVAAADGRPVFELNADVVVKGAPS